MTDEIINASLNIEPLISIPQFFIGYIIVLLLCKVIADYIIYRQGKRSGEAKQDKRKQSASKAVERYYMDKGA